MALIRFLAFFIVFLMFPTAPVWSDVDMGLLKKGVVKVSAQYSKSEKVGTGFIVGKGTKHLFIVTASHVVEGESEIPQSINVTFFTHQEEPLVAEVINKEGGDPRGLALLKVGRPPRRCGNSGVGYPNPIPRRRRTACDRVSPGWRESMGGDERNPVRI